MVDFECLNVQMWSIEMTQLPINDSHYSDSLHVVSAGDHFKGVSSSGAPGAAAAAGMFDANASTSEGESSSLRKHYSLDSLEEVSVTLRSHLSLLEKGTVRTETGI